MAIAPPFAPVVLPASFPMKVEDSIVVGMLKVAIAPPSPVCVKLSKNIESSITRGPLDPEEIAPPVRKRYSCQTGY